MKKKITYIGAGCFAAGFVTGFMLPKLAVVAVAVVVIGLVVASR
jgi:hypothetical protein